MDTTLPQGRIPDPLESDHDITNGWHTVFAIRYPDVNAAIVKAGASPDDYLQVETSGTRTASISGPFSDWQLTTGGDGRNLRMTLPSALLRYEDTTQPGPREFAAVTFVIEVELQFLPQPDQDHASAAGVWYDLKLDFEKLRNSANQAFVIDLLYAGTDMDGLTKATLMGLMADWLNANAQEFNHVFATVNLNAKADVDDFQWMVPTHVSYGCTDRGTPESSIFAVLCMTDNVSAEGLAHQVSVDAIPEGERSAFLISKERFLRRMVLPGIGGLFSDPQESGRVWPDDYFELRSDDTIITNESEVSIDQMDFSEKGDGSKTYKATVQKEKFTFEFHGDYVSVTYTDLYHDYRHFGLFYKVFHTFSVNLSARVDETGVFKLEPVQDKLSNDQEFLGHHIVVQPTEVTKWVEIGLLAAMLFGSIYGLKGVQWAEVRGGALATKGATLVGEGTAYAAEGLTEAELRELQIQAATEQLGWLRRGFLVGKAWFKASVAAVQANILVRIAGGAYSAEKILQLIADGDSKGELPTFQDFAARVMTPVQWPDAADYKVTSLAFNDCLQVVGDAGFTHGKA